MDELVDQIARDTGLDRAVAGKAIGIIIGFLINEGPPGKVGAMIDRLPGARALAEANSSRGGGGGLLGVFNDLTGAGLGIADVQAVAGAFLAYARENVGKDEVDEVVAAIPGLGQFI